MLPEKVIWTEGMLLRPQHFQQQDRYTAALARRGAEIFFHYPWGLTELKIDEQYLSLGKFVLSRVSGVFPDGVIFESDAGDILLSLDIPAGLTNQLIYLTMPLSPEGSAEAGQMEGGAGLATRYLCHAVEVGDSNAGQPGSYQIQCGALNLKLMLESELNREGYIAMPIARMIESQPDGTIILDGSFSPTFLHLSSSAMLSGYILELIGLLSHRGDQLAGRIRGAGQSGTAEVVDFILLQCINRVEPVFRHMAKIISLHPEEFYVHLISLIGELATFVDASKRPRDNLIYDHNSQHESISAAMEQARELLSMVLEQHSVELPMQERQYGIIVSPIHDRSMLATASFIVSAQADMDPELLRTSLPKQLKIGPVERIRQLVNLHLPGVKLRALPVAPRQIPFHAGKSYFRLEITSEESAQLELSGGFAFYISGDFPGIKLQFWAIKE
ncbi:type VI secretion system baseplate subunit TssK [Deltaproteobacteria bacterium Smac51]|nr:type VI secretion system baseplate subunit TssK [Deltaproteobacteria bacterium Smac51]